MARGSQNIKGQLGTPFHSCLEQSLRVHALNVVQAQLRLCAQQHQLSIVCLHIRVRLRRDPLIVSNVMDQDRTAVTNRLAAACLYLRNEVMCSRFLCDE